MFIKRILTCTLLLFFSLSSAMDKEKEHDQSKQIVLYKNVQCLKAAQTLNKHSVFIFNCLDSIHCLEASSGYLPQDLSLHTKKSFVSLYMQEIKSPNVHLKGLSERQMQGAKCLCVIDSWQLDRQDPLDFDSSQIEDIKTVPSYVVHYLLKRKKIVRVPLPWYKPSIQQRKYINISGLAAGLVCCTTFLYGVSKSGFIPIKDCVIPLTGCFCIGGLLGAAVMYIKDVIFSEKKRYERFIISPNPSAKAVIRWENWDE